jgi:hypothetical protein
MKRTLVFEGEKGTRQAGLLYMLFVMGSSHGEKRSVTDARNEARFMDAMDTIGSLNQSDPNVVNIDTFKLKEETTELPLEHVVYALLVKYVETAITVISPSLVREAVRLLDWLESAPKTEID